jgi:endonuclease VIII
MADGAGGSPLPDRWGQAGDVPEGHTIHRLAIDHAAALAGQPVGVSSPQGRFAGADRVDGAVLDSTEAWGKHLFYRFEGERIVHVHLGLYGKFTGQPLPSPEPRPTCRMRLEGEDVVLDLVGPITCRLVTPDEREDVVDRLGPDPIRPDADRERMWTALQRRRIPIGQALLDQRIVAGVGNVFRAEALFVHGIDPTRPARDLTRDEFEALWATLVVMLRRGVTDGRIITVDPKEIGTTRRKIRRADATYVYKRDDCLRCGTPIRRWDMAGRWAYACPTCQAA